jgi:hypothetical protein
LADMRLFINNTASEGVMGGRSLIAFGPRIL